MEVEGIRAFIQNDKLNHPFFDYLDDNQKQEIEERLLSGKSHIVMFVKNGAELFASVIDTVQGGFHIREAGGNYLRNSHILWIYLLGILDRFGGNVLTLAYISRRASILVAKKYGFSTNSFGDYEVRFNRGR